MSDATLKRPPEQIDHHLGSLNATVVIVEYGDYECPHCADAVSVIDQIMKTNEDICYIFRHFPMTSHHANAGVAAMAVEAAGKQNKFWEMHKELFKHQKDLGSEKIFSLARDLGLDVRKFTNDLEDENLLKHVQNDFDSGMQSGVDGTPTIYVNGVNFQDEITVGALQAEVDEILIDDSIHPL